LKVFKINDFLMVFKGKGRKVLAALLIFTWFTITCQNKQKIVTPTRANGEKCATKLPAGFAAMKQGSAQVFNLVNTLKHDTCLNKKFSVVFYVVKDSFPLVNNGGVTQVNMNRAIDSLNSKFKRICVSFMNCSTVVIPNWIYNDWNQNPTESQVTSNWYTVNTINIYLVGQVNGTTTAGGYAYMPGTPGNKDIIVIRKTQLNTVLLYHLIGHFFGLPDTYAEVNPVPAAVPPPPLGITSQEFATPTSTNCGQAPNGHGDTFCDTEADPYPAGFVDNNFLVAPCFFQYGPVDGQGKYYIPPVDNYMSEYRFSCRCKYTQEQYNWMATIILTQKLYLH
jgi:hypothetical protein